MGKREVISRGWGGLIVGVQPSPERGEIGVGETKDFGGGRIVGSMGRGLGPKFQKATFRLFGGRGTDIPQSHQKLTV